VGEELKKIELNKGLKRIMDFSKFCNQYFQGKEPWANKTQAKNCLYLCINAVRSLAILLEPYLPASTEILWKQLNLQGSVHEQRWDSASELAIEGGHKITEPTILFEKVENEKIEEERERLRRLTT
ncbi:MAG: class I tRNA ligase family protein, partial [Candidatus Bathyarchaeota archaeon]